MALHIHRRLVMAIISFCPFFTSCEAQSEIKTILAPAAGSPINMNCSPGNVAAADLNKDGKPDLVVACAQQRKLTLFKGRGDGQFEAFSANGITMSYAPHEISIGDMNKDGNADLVIANHDSYTVQILRGDGKGNFAASPDTLVMKKGNHAHTHGLGIADMNGDSFIDIVTANNADNDIAVMFSTSNSGYAPASGSPYPVKPSPYPLTVGDVNGDGHPDVASTSTHAGSRALSILLGDGKGSFRRTDIALRTASPWYVSIGDVNNDKKPDLAITHSERNELSVLLGNGNDSFTEVSGSPFNLNSSAWHVAIADINRDGHADIVAAANNGVRIMLGDGKGNFTPAPGSPFQTGKGTWHLAVADVNADGKPDVVTSNLESNSVSVLLGK